MTSVLCLYLKRSRYCVTVVCYRVLELEESLGSSHLLQQNIKQKDEKVSSLNQVIQEREEKLAELENRSQLLIFI